MTARDAAGFEVCRVGELSTQAAGRIGAGDVTRAAYLLAEAARHAEVASALVADDDLAGMGVGLRRAARLLRAGDIEAFEVVMAGLNEAAGRLDKSLGV